MRGAQTGEVSQSRQTSASVASAGPCEDLSAHSFNMRQQLRNINGNNNNNNTNAAAASNSFQWPLFHEKKYQVLYSQHASIIYSITHGHTPNHFTAPFSRTTWESRCQKKASSGLYCARAQRQTHPKSGWATLHPD